MKNVRLNKNAVDVFWLIEFRLDALSKSLILKLGCDPDSKQIEQEILFDGIVDINIDFFNDDGVDYIPTFLGLLTNDEGKYVLTTDVFEAIFHSNDLRVVKGNDKK